MLDKSSKAEASELVLATYAALLERRLIVPSTSSSYFAVDQHFFFSIFAQIIANIYFDESWYLTKYPDIQEALKKGVVSSARHHYQRFGFYEHRLPYKIDIQEAWYLEAYPDVKKAIERRDYASGQEHFETAGFLEGRLPYPNFALRQAEPNDLES
jgi:hypothetical protein